MFWCRSFLINFYFLEHYVPFLILRLFKKVFYDHIFESFTCSARSVPFFTNSNVVHTGFSLPFVFLLFCLIISHLYSFSHCFVISSFLSAVVDNILVTWLLFLIPLSYFRFAPSLNSSIRSISKSIIYLLLLEPYYSSILFLSSISAPIASKPIRIISVIRSNSPFK